MDNSNEFVNIYIEKLNEKIYDITRESVITSTHIVFYNKQIAELNKNIEQLQASLKEEAKINDEVAEQANSTIKQLNTKIDGYNPAIFDNLLPFEPFYLVK